MSEQSSQELDRTAIHDPQAGGFPAEKPPSIPGRPPNRGRRPTRTSAYLSATTPTMTCPKTSAPPPLRGNVRKWRWAVRCRSRR
jgi:hypothetical protein